MRDLTYDELALVSGGAGTESFNGGWWDRVWDWVQDFFGFGDTPDQGIAFGFEVDFSVDGSSIMPQGTEAHVDITVQGYAEPVNATFSVEIFGYNIDFLHLRVTGPEPRPA